MSALRPLRRGIHLLGARSVAQRASVGVNGTLTLPQLASPHVRCALRSPASGRLIARNLPVANGVRYASSAASLGSLRKTQLYDLHIAKGAKMVPFAGYSMPLQYSDLSHVESHKWTREKASLFDVSHMVQHRLSGPGALDLLMKVTPSSLDKLENNSSTLSCLLEPGTGGIVDDTVITRLSTNTFYFVTNAGRRDEDLAFFTAEIDAFKAAHGAGKEITWEILSGHSLIALQGPEAAATLQPLIHNNGADSDLSTLYFGNCRSLHLNLPDGTQTQEPLLISRTGYTGEDGFEISIPPSVSPSTITELLLQNPSVRLAGLAARDSLRLEAGMCLYGHDISTAQTPPAAALGWIVGKDRRDLSASSDRSQFNGAATIIPQLASPSKNLSQRRVGFTIEKGSPAREGAVIIDLNDESKTQIGVITSGLPSPSLGGTNIAMGYIKQGLHKKGTEVGVVVRNKVRKATVVGMPWVESKFYRKPSP
ncbi:glycine decarboxylase subunit T [Aspergillus foveolatus]|uniref:glycine decarboxylase subunit T n=1 Tax=Aspergillus foveolatus TaxID=210207 RepID=UPI003CCCEFEF